MNSEQQDNVGIALSLTVAAGASTAIGAAVVFFPRIVKMASRRVLASSLGFAAGVMCYVSFMDIARESQALFVESGLDEDKSDIYATFCFFGGVLIMIILDFVVAKLLGASGHNHHQPGPMSVPTTNKKEESVPPTTITDTIVEEDVASPCCLVDPVRQLDTMHKIADKLEREENPKTEEDPDPESQVPQDNDDYGADSPVSVESTDPSDDDIVGDVSEDQEVDLKEKVEKKRLVKMGMNTAIAIGLHNFPEGLATFVGGIHDPSVGAVLAIAIAIHNIPEGLCVALPIYYATGNRCKAFWWAVLSGASEVVAALLGWAALASIVSDTTYGILFGVVAGMMVIISIRELLPTAHYYDPEDTVVTNSFIAGMVVMAVSLILFIV
eukprot:scaffold2575_cov101-Cylindrotheca_fusiformis.AAC.3